MVINVGSMEDRSIGRSGYVVWQTAMIRCLTTYDHWQDEGLSFAATILDRR